MGGDVAVSVGPGVDGPLHGVVRGPGRGVVRRWVPGSQVGVGGGLGPHRVAGGGRPGSRRRARCLPPGTWGGPGKWPGSAAFRVAAPGWRGSRNCSRGPRHRGGLLQRDGRGAGAPGSAPPGSTGGERPQQSKRGPGARPGQSRGPRLAPVGRLEGPAPRPGACGPRPVYALGIGARAPEPRGLEAGGPPAPSAGPPRAAPPTVEGGTRWMFVQGEASGKRVRGRGGSGSQARGEGGGDAEERARGGGGRGAGRRGVSGTQGCREETTRSRVPIPPPGLHPPPWPPTSAAARNREPHGRPGPGGPALRGGGAHGRLTHSVQTPPSAPGSYPPGVGGI